MDDIFKKGDTVYHHRYGKAIIIDVYQTMATVNCENGYTDLYYDELSFTPYTISVNHVRPTPDIEEGQLIWVKDSSDHLYWQLLPFEFFFTEKSVSIIVAGGIYWNLYSITNPYDPKLPCFQK
ncbi:MAG: hypothetical protein IPF70_16850 [Saprospiraceae bacterium]|jgi:hypothetical protein|nr:hypothetical protein [Saprospiraceae bacterium]